MGLNEAFNACYVIDRQLFEVCGDLGREIVKTLISIVRVISRPFFITRTSK